MLNIVTLLFSEKKKSVNKYLFLILFGLASFSWSQDSAALPICADEYPQYSNIGYIVINIEFDSTCPAGGNRKYTIIEARSSSYSDVCQQSDIPTGYVITGKGRHSNCATIGEGVTVDIKTVSGSVMDVCDGSPIPGGWVVSRVQQTSACNSGITLGTGPGYRIIIPDGSSNYICQISGTSIPAGWVITKRDLHADCAISSSTSGARTQIRTPSNNLNVCDGSTLPTGYVFNSYNSSTSGCGYGGVTSGPGWKILEVTGTSSIRVCNTTEPYLPTGWVIIEKKNYIQCDNKVGATIIKPTSGSYWVCDGSPLPAGFVITARANNLNQCEYITGASRRGQQIELPTSRTLVCLGSPVPEGWAFTASGQYAQCNEDIGTGVGYWIEPIPSEGAVVCWGPGLQIPTGMVITAIDTYSQCNNSIGGYTLKTPATGGVSTDVCQGSPIPDGFIISGYKNSYPLCGNTELGFTIREPDTVGSSTACLGSPIPLGYVVSAVSSYQQCSGALSSQGFTIILPDGEGPFTVCHTTSVPQGMVIIAEGVASQCSVTSSGTGFTIVFPKPKGLTIVCNTSPLPAGYVVEGAASAPNCTGGGGRSIRPLVALIDPDEFINPEVDVVPGSVPAVSYDCSNVTPQGGVLAGAAANSAQCP